MGLKAACGLLLTMREGSSRANVTLPALCSPGSSGPCLHGALDSGASLWSATSSKCTTDALVHDNPLPGVCTEFVRLGGSGLVNTRNTTACAAACPRGTIREGSRCEPFRVYGVGGS